MNFCIVYIFKSVIFDAKPYRHGGKRKQKWWQVNVARMRYLPPLLLSLGAMSVWLGEFVAKGVGSLLEF